MLRTLVLVVAAIGFTAALVGAVVDPGVWPTALAAAVILGGIVFERARYGAARLRPHGDDWRETPERFIDDASGKAMTVWYNPATGERRYVAAED